MKIIYLSICVLLLPIAWVTATEIIDPVKDFLQSPHPSFLSTHPSNFFKSDSLLRLNIDLNKDGIKEVLLSLSRERDGKAGNIWSVYRQNEKGYENIGRMTFQRSGFYLGWIDEIQKYGLVSFWSGGAGEGSFCSHVFDGKKIEENFAFARVEYDSRTQQYKGRELFKKYFDDKAIRGKDVIQEIPIQELAQKYGIKVESKTYQQAIEEQARGETNAPSPQLPSSPQTSVSPTTQSLPPAFPQTNTTSKSIQITAFNNWPLIGWIGLGAVVVGVVTYLLLKK